MEEATLRASIPQSGDLTNNIADLKERLKEVKTQALEASEIYQRLGGDTEEEREAKKMLAIKLGQYKCVDGIDLVLRSEEAL